MGLKGIHDPEALQHFSGYTYCPWCGKSGQNEWTIMNHLRTTHYKLGLICQPSALVALQQHQTLSTDMATSTAQIRALPPGGSTQLDTPWSLPRQFHFWQALFPKTVTILNGRKALTAIPSAPLLEAISIQQTWYVAVDTGQLSQCPPEQPKNNELEYQTS